MLDVTQHFLDDVPQTGFPNHVFDRILGCQFHCCLSMRMITCFDCTSHPWELTGMVLPSAVVNARKDAKSTSTRTTIPSVGIFHKTRSRVYCFEWVFQATRKKKKENHKPQENIKSLNKLQRHDRRTLLRQKTV